MVTRQTSNDLESGDIHIWRIDLDRPIEDLALLLSSDETERASAKKLSRDRERFIKSHGAMRDILGQYLGMPGDKLLLVAGEKGKPSLAHEDSSIQFNLTHCEGMALLVVSANTPVGIDLELIRSRPSQIKIAQRMFSQKIYNEMASLSPDQFEIAFFLHWTELEARAKCIGAGIFSNDSELHGITTKHFTPQDGWIACVAVRGVELSELDLKYFVYGK